MTQLTTRIDQPATDKQVAYLKRLAADRPSVRDAVLDAIETGLTKRRASAAIERLAEIPHEIVAAAPRKRQPVPADVPAGRYAIGPDGATRFYRVDRPTDGKWAGYVFVSEIHGPDERRAVRNPDERRRVLLAVGVGAEAATKRFGVETGTCGVCGLQLTDPESVANGIGPVCESKRGY